MMVMPAITNVIQPAKRLPHTSPLPGKPPKITATPARAAKLPSRIVAVGRSRKNSQPNRAETKGAAA
ncbi:hypothetical protein TH25_15970 [Thalassospira profundimaris]|uniref:Uncharacterized protein n=1 Tax=Thalassospira profundimaris TaxID=502049 RepID=A0A367X006_9PROT|nr:hypothetical protein TH25_15970 [Thalassospira profundimaris]